MQRGSLVSFIRKDDNVRNRAVLAKELQAGGYTRVVVRDGELAFLAHVKAARAMTLVSAVPLESAHEQVSKEQSPGILLAEGAVKELKAKNSYIKTQHRNGSWEANLRDS